MAYSTKSFCDSQHSTFRVSSVGEYTVRLEHGPDLGCLWRRWSKAFVNDDSLCEYSPEHSPTPPEPPASSPLVGRVSHLNWLYCYTDLHMHRHPEIVLRRKRNIPRYHSRPWERGLRVGWGR